MEFKIWGEKYVAAVKDISKMKNPPFLQIDKQSIKKYSKVLYNFASQFYNNNTNLVIVVNMPSPSSYRRVNKYITNKNVKNFLRIDSKGNSKLIDLGDD